MNFMIIKKEASVEEFYAHLRGGFEGNNNVYKVEVTFYDGLTPMRIIFETPQGFVEDQKQRKGQLELKID